MFLLVATANLLSQMTFNLWTEVTREIATLNCPWEKIGFRRSNPTWATDWPWDLLIVIAKQSRMGNCQRQNSNGTCVSAGIIPIHGINTVSPACWSVINWISKTLFQKCVRIPWEPLQTPLSGIFLRSRTGHPFLSSSLWRERPKRLIAFKYSTGYSRHCLNPYTW